MALQPYLNRTKGPAVSNATEKSIDSEYRFGRNDGSRNSVTKPRNGIPSPYIFTERKGVHILEYEVMLPDEI